MAETWKPPGWWFTDEATIFNAGTVRISLHTGAPKPPAPGWEDAPTITHQIPTSFFDYSPPVTIDGFRITNADGETIYREGSAPDVWVIRGNDDQP